MIIAPQIIAAALLGTALVAGGIGAVGGYRWASGACDRERAQIAEAREAAIRRTRELEDALLAAQGRTIIQHRETVRVVKEKADAVAPIIAQAEAAEPAITDPRCAWPDGVRDAVNTARAGAEADRAERADDPMRAPRERVPRPAR